MSPTAHQLEPSVAVRSVHHRDLRPYALEPHDAVHRAAFDGHLAQQHESELGEELGRGREVVDDCADVVHPLDSQVLDGKETRSRDVARMRFVRSAPRAHPAICAACSSWTRRAVRRKSRIVASSRSS
jgi:hypothetical protein